LKSDKGGVYIKRILKIAIPYTIPVMLGYISVGMAYGLLIVKSGISLWAGLAMSVFLYAGAMQFVAIQILIAPINLIQVALMTLFVNIRHLFYGLSFVDTFKSYGWKKQYLIFGMTDETYSLLCGVSAQEEIEQETLFFTISILNQSYWIVGTVLGALVGNMIHFDTTGIDFAMTALFVVIFIEQWLANKNHLPAITGVLSAIIAIKIFGPSQMVLPAMVMMFSFLLVVRRYKSGGDNRG
jgi:Predicted branched-chain amino acid permease (azaleucine resistance)